MKHTVGFLPAHPKVQRTTTPRVGLCSTNLWSNDQHRSATHGGAALDVVGDCFATHKELQSALQADDGFASLMDWPGNYVVRLSTPTKEVVVGNLSGAMPVHYVAHRGGWWWSTNATSLAALVSASVDHVRVALNLTVSEMDDFQTIFSGVTTVPPGSMLEVTQGKLTIKEWHPVMRTDSTFEEAAANLRKALLASIERRAQLANTFGSDLSGGYDSSSVAALMSRHVPVTGFTQVDATSKKDQHYAKLVAAHSGTRQVVVNTSNEELSIAPFTGTMPHLFTDQPSQSLTSAVTDMRKLALARRLGVEHYLTGRGGDNVLTSLPSRSADAFLDGHKRMAMRLVFSQARVTTIAPLQAFRSMVWTSMRTHRQAVLAMSRLVLSGSTPDPKDTTPFISWLAPLPALHWLTQPGREQAAERLVGFANKAHATKPAQLAAWRYLKLESESMRYLHAIAESCGLTLHSPFMDNAVVAACLALPSYLKVQPSAYKPILYAAVGDLLPSELAGRITKDGSTGPAYRKYRHNQWAFSQIAHESPLVESGILSSEAIIGSLERTALGLHAPLSSLDMFFNTDAWLKALDIRRERWWKQ